MTPRHLVFSGSSDLGCDGVLLAQAVCKGLGPISLVCKGLWASSLVASPSGYHGGCQLFVSPHILMNFIHFG